jgi:hypothetical protein
MYNVKTLHRYNKFSGILEFSKAICWISENKHGIARILHLFDDFLTIDAPDEDRNRTMALLTMIFTKLNVPLAKHKTMSPLTMIEYLGIILDSDIFIFGYPTCRF